MWLFTKHGFYSVTKAEYTKKKNLYQIRARTDVDLINLKNEVTCLRAKKVHCFEGADYRYRIFVFPSELAQVFDRLQDTLDYSNFKNKVHATPNQADKYSFYSKVWGVMFGYQRSKEHAKLGIIDGKGYGQQLSITGGYEETGIGEFGGSEHEPEPTELNDYPRFRELPFTEEQEGLLYSDSKEEER